MASITLDLSSQYLYFGTQSNIASVGASSITTTALAKNGGQGYIYIEITNDLFWYGSVESVIVTYKAYGSRTGIAGSKAQIEILYWDSTTSENVVAFRHGDVGRGSSNATSYTDKITCSGWKSGGLCQFCFRFTNPIAAQTNTVYVTDISIEVNYTPAYNIRVTANNSDYGTVTGGGIYEHGKTVTLTATPKTGYKFVQWNDGNTSATRTITVTGNAAYTATFEKLPSEITDVEMIYGGKQISEDNKVISGQKFIISVTVT